MRSTRVRSRSPFRGPLRFRIEVVCPVARLGVATGDGRVLEVPVDGPVRTRPLPLPVLGHRRLHWRHEFPRFAVGIGEVYGVEVSDGGILRVRAVLRGNIRNVVDAVLLRYGRRALALDLDDMDTSLAEDGVTLLFSYWRIMGFTVVKSLAWQGPDGVMGPVTVALRRDRRKGR